MTDKNLFELSTFLTNTYSRPMHNLSAALRRSILSSYLYLLHAIGA